jgi:hypothetical protein
MAGHQFVGTGRLLRMASGFNHRLSADERLGHGALCSCTPGGALAADMWPALNFPVDSLEIFPLGVSCGE